MERYAGLNRAQIAGDRVKPTLQQADRLAQSKQLETALKGAAKKLGAKRGQVKITRLDKTKALREEAIASSDLVQVEVRGTKGHREKAIISFLEPYQPKRFPPHYLFQRDTKGPRKKRYVWTEYKLPVFLSRVVEKALSAMLGDAK